MTEGGSRFDFIAACQKGKQPEVVFCVWMALQQVLDPALGMGKLPHDGGTSSRSPLYYFHLICLPAEQAVMIIKGTDKTQVQ